MFVVFGQPASQPADSEAAPDRRVVAWTSLRYPAVRAPELRELEEARTAEPEGMDAELSGLFGQVLGATKDVGYDPGKHFRTSLSSVIFP